MTSHGAAATPSPPMKFYVASRVAHAQKWQQYRSCGANIISSWIDEAGPGQTDDWIEFWDRVTSEIKEADRLILYAESADFPLKGALIETGIAVYERAGAISLSQAPVSNEQQVVDADVTLHDSSKRCFSGVCCLGSTGVQQAPDCDDAGRNSVETKMSIFVYISHSDPVHALVAAQELMIVNALPFVPSLNKLVVGRSDEEWVKYYRNWMLKCDVVLATKSHRKHELDFARENHIPIAFTTQEAVAVNLPPFAELGRRFGEAVAANLPKDEDWRRRQADEVSKEFQNLCGLGRRPMDVAVVALQAWDRETNG